GRLAVHKGLHHVYPAAARPVREGTAQRGGLHLLRGALGVAARDRAVDHATAAPLRGPPGALPGPAGALLAPRLGTATAYLAAGLGLVRALPGGGELGHHHLVHQGLVRRRVEDVRRQLHRAGRAAVAPDHVNRGHAATAFRTAERTSTSDPRGPGSAPLISSRSFSGSTACTVRFCTVKRTPPMRPAIRVPLNTRPGVAQPPIAPGERCLRSTPCDANRPWKPWRFITPVKPLPLVRPVTST